MTFKKITNNFIASIFSIFLLSTAAYADPSGPVQSGNIDEWINQKISPITQGVSSIIFYSIPVRGTELPLIVVWLLLGAFIFTVYFRFINIRGIRTSINVVKGKYDTSHDPGEITHFQALTAALSGTVGLGNIAGVAVAVSIGGPGATFWMIIGGLLGMSSKFVECTLGVKYRKINSKGQVSGGPMYYIQKAFQKKGLPKAGKVMAGIFAILCVGGSFGGGNLFQVNQAGNQLLNITGGEESFLFDKMWVFGVFMATLVYLVIVGGIKSIAKVTDKIVPFMCLVYLIMGLIILTSHSQQLGSAFSLIFSEAINPQAVTGGVLGVLVVGIQRATFSNEAGVGSSPIAHSAVKTTFPVSEGLVALLEPFIDTVVICTMTALVLIVTGSYGNTNGIEGIQLTSDAFATVIPGADLFLAGAVFLFAFSTMISWSYYGIKAWTYLFGHTHRAELTYKLLFCFCVTIGASMSLSSVIDFSDAMIFAMAFPNFIGLYILAPEVKKDLADYLKMAKAGVLKEAAKKVKLKK